MEIQCLSDTDEIQNFIDGRWVCALEARWRIFKFPLHRMCPSVMRLQIHLPNMHNVCFSENQSIDNILLNEDSSCTMLTDYFRINREDSFACRLLYNEFPEFYRWVASGKK